MRDIKNSLMPQLSIIILTFNSSGFIRACLDSVFKQSYQDYEVILVDNGSSDNTLSLIKENYSKVRLIENKENSGACSARNRGIEHADGKWILTLDCDIVLEKDFLEKMMECAQGSDGSVGIVQPKVLQMDKTTIYSCGIRVSGSRRFFDIGKGRPDNGEYNGERDVFGACSAAALYRREMLEEIRQDTGYFDERFFFLVEDVDLSWRAQKKGWKARFYPNAVCYHPGNSSGLNRKTRQYLCFRNRYYLMIKNDNIPSLRSNLISLFFYDFARFFFFLLTKPYTFKALKEVSIFLNQENKACQ